MTDIEDLRRDITDLFAAADEDLAELAEQARRVAAEAFRAPTVAQARALLNEVGIHTHRSALIVELERSRRRRPAAGRRVVRGRRPQRSRRRRRCRRVGAGRPVRHPGEQGVVGRRRPRGGPRRGAAVGDRRREEVVPDPGGRRGGRGCRRCRHLRTAEAAAAEARDAVTLANTSVSARKHVLDSCVAELQVLAVALTAPRQAT